MSSDLEKHYIDITYKNINKKNALLYLKDRLKTDKIIAFGDNMNDYEMLDLADISICVDNSVPALKQMCDYVTTSVEENGVEKWLKENYLTN